MAGTVAPNIVTDGLVLYLDAANVKSFKGEPTTNLISNPIVGDYGNSPGSTNNTISPDGSNNATIPIPDANADRYQIAIAGGNHPSGTQFTYSWHYKQLGPHLGTSPNEPGGLLITGLVNCTLVGTATKLYDLNDGWSRWKATFQIVDGSLESIFRLYFGFVIGINGNSAAYYGHQFEQKTYATPFVIGTRGTTVATGGGWGDISRNNNHGELINGPTFDSRDGGSIVFDGVNDSINCDANSILNVGNNITVNTWFYVNSNSSYQPIISKTLSNSTAGWELANSSGVFRTTFRPSVTQINLIAGSLVIGKWYMGTMTFDGTTARLYLNGVITGNTTTGGPVTLNSSQPLQIGTRGIDANWYNGNISQASIYNRALSAQEVLQNYNSTKTRFGL